MTDSSLAHDGVHEPTTPLDRVAARVEEELARIRKHRPWLEERLDRASGIIVTHLSCPRQRLIRVRIRLGDGAAMFLVNGSHGEVYRVSPIDWSCSCPDHHRRDAICKHALAAYILRRAALPAQRKRTCDGCEQLFPRRELVELYPENHDGMMHSDGDLLCKPCANRSGVEC